jgi:RNA polymerase sigma-70 factor (ECF subfamily)
MDYASLPPDELVRICVQTGHARAWEEFIRRFNPLIAREVVRTARRWGDYSRSLLDDLVQETYLKICAEDCRLLRTFQAREPDAIYGYLKVVTKNVVHDHLKATHAVKRGSGEVAEDIEDVGLNGRRATQDSQSSQKSVERQILLQEIDRYLTRFVSDDENPQRSRLIFWLYYRSGLSAKAIASIPGIDLTTKGVESTLLRLRRMVKFALADPTSEHNEKQEHSSKNQKGIMGAESF